jgi:hypothetical protein
MTPEEIQKYEKAIPDCCRFRTFSEHCDYLMLCWGILSAIKANEPMKCVSCEFATRNTEDAKIDG